MLRGVSLRVFCKVQGLLVSGTVFRFMGTGISAASVEVWTFHQIHKVFPHRRCLVG